MYGFREVDLFLRNVRKEINIKSHKFKILCLAFLLSQHLSRDRTLQ